MPRSAQSTDSLITDLQSRLARLVETARREGREEALADVRAIVGGGAGPARGRKPGADAAPPPAAPKKPKKKRKNPWASMTPEQKKERVRKMLAGRGLEPKSDE